MIEKNKANAVRGKVTMVVGQIAEVGLAGQERPGLYEVLTAVAEPSVKLEVFFQTGETVSAFILSDQAKLYRGM